MARLEDSKTCPFCGGTEIALRMSEGDEEMNWCGTCYRVWFRPVPAAEPARRSAAPRPTRA